MRKKRIAVIMMAAVMAVSAAPIPAMAANETASETALVQTSQEYEPMYRLYNPNSGEHFYTARTAERDHLVHLGWNYEGIGWNAPKDGVPVFRLYNKNAGDHHYTTSAAERNHLVSLGWKYEGIGWKSGGSLPVYRQYNPNVKKAGAHNYTLNINERNNLVRLGWNDENIGFYAVDPTAKPSPGPKQETKNDSQKDDTKKNPSENTGKTDSGKTDTKDSGTTIDTPSTDTGKETVKDKGQRIEGNENYGHYEEVFAEWCKSCGRVFWTHNDATVHFRHHDGSDCDGKQGSAGGMKKIWVWDDVPYIVNPYGEDTDIPNNPHERFYSEEDWENHINAMKRESEYEEKIGMMQKYRSQTEEYNMIKDYKWTDHVQQPTK